MSIGPITLALLDGRSTPVADEMDAMLYRAAVSPIIAETRDAWHGLYQATPGDTFFNDWHAGFMSLNDMRPVRPVFRGGTLFCWIASAEHWLDLGSNGYTGYNPSAADHILASVRMTLVTLIRAGGMTAPLVSKVTGLLLVTGVKLVLGILLLPRPFGRGRPA